MVNDLLMAEDTRHLVTRGRTYWLQIAVPRKLHGRLPKTVQRSLQTKSLKEAQTLRWAWINAYRHAWTLAIQVEALSREEVEAIAKAEHARLEALEGRRG